MKADVEKPAQNRSEVSGKWRLRSLLGRIVDPLGLRYWLGLAQRPENQPRPEALLPENAGFFRRVGSFLAFQAFSSLRRRIVLLNLLGLVTLVSGILYLSEYRAGLIEARVQSLLTQGEIIAAAIASTTRTDASNIPIDPEKLLELQAGESYLPSDDLSALEFPINPETVAPLLRRLITPINTRARIYDRDGGLLLDSRTLSVTGEILRFDLPSLNEQQPQINPIRAWWRSVRLYFRSGGLPIYKEIGTANGKGYTEVDTALTGQSDSEVRVNERGEVIISVAIPVQRFRGVLGVLMLQTQGGEIDNAVEAERLVIVRVFLIAAAVMIVLSFLLAGTIAGPMRRLAEAAEHVRRRTRSRVEIPDMTARADEIGHLSGAFRDMTNSLYSRIEAIESFAADVAHELKNPLTSLRSAIETLPLAKNEESRERLLAVIQHDIKRLDRLISDISDASRLDADLLRHEAEPVDLRKLLTAVSDIANDVPREDGVSVEVLFEPKNGQFAILGNDSRLGQVIDNLVENARSFSPQNGKVRVLCKRTGSEIEIAVEDEGPGVRPEALTRIFERFYTDRPAHRFGQNSGLGLSISKQIVEAHGGRIWAENRLAAASNPGDAPKIAGARFVMRLPAAKA
ncbi:MAG: stimulus-sensing domain-containing protein [Xanthobacteraceae bacterium]|nr:stimulus-sensing domain-containing protein [Xanthobacteraceae bacterium]